MNPEAALVTRRLEPGASLVLPRPWQAPPVQMSSPAVEVMTDLTQVKAVTTRSETTLVQAEQTMIAQGVRSLFVVDEMPAIVGLMTTTDLHGSRAMRLTGERRLRYDELTVADVMTPLAALDAIDFGALKTATVANVVATLKKHGRNHLLIVDAISAGGPHRVRGVISRTQIERQTGQRIDITEVANSFAELGRMLS